VVKNQRDDQGKPLLVGLGGFLPHLAHVFKKLQLGPRTQTALMLNQDVHLGRIATFELDGPLCQERAVSPTHEGALSGWSIFGDHFLSNWSILGYQKQLQNTKWGLTKSQSVII
jgi:hypothetical protein